MANRDSNQYFTDPNSPMGAITHILMDLDRAGALTYEMKEALHCHFKNYADTLPRGIMALSQAMAAANDGNTGIDSADAAQASWAIASLAEVLHAAYHIVGQLKTIEMIEGELAVAKMLSGNHHKGGSLNG